MRRFLLEIVVGLLVGLMLGAVGAGYPSTIVELALFVVALMLVSGVTRSVFGALGQAPAPERSHG